MRAQEGYHRPNWSPKPTTTTVKIVPRDSFRYLIAALERVPERTVQLNYKGEVFVLRPVLSKEPYVKFRKEDVDN